MLAALNTDPKEGAASLAGRIIRETIMRGGKYVRPLIAHEGLGHALVEPALTYLASRNATVRFGDRMRALDLADGKVKTLDFGDSKAELTSGDCVILAVRQWWRRRSCPVSRPNVISRDCERAFPP